jgi:hypothetical protein
MSSVLARYTSYYSEKLWEMIPAVYRGEDGLADRPGQLRAFVEILAEQAALLRMSQDRLWDDQYVESADDWAIPYIGDLLATRMISERNKRGRRIDVAKTVYYRRRKGTMQILEELISDITGWEGTVIEEMNRLSRFPHGLDPEPSRSSGHLTGTLPGGLAQIRRPRGVALVGGPFDEFHYTPDVRKPREKTGRYGIARLAFHLYRIQAYRIEHVVPHEWPTGSPGRRRFNLDPSGRDVPLFVPRSRSKDWDQWIKAQEWDLPHPMGCRLLDQAEYVMGQETLSVVKERLGEEIAQDVARLEGILFPDEETIRQNIHALRHDAVLEDPTLMREMLRTSLVSHCGKATLLPNPENTRSGAVKVEIMESLSGEEAETIVPRTVTASANLEDWRADPVDKELVIDPERGRMLLLDRPSARVRVEYVYGFSGPIGAGAYHRPGVVPDPDTVFSSGVNGSMSGEGVYQFGGQGQAADSATYDAPPNVSNVGHLSLQGANGQRPFVRLATDWVFAADQNRESSLSIEGLWVGTKANIRPLALILRGDYGHVRISNASLDPGGTNGRNQPLRPVAIRVEGHVDELSIEKSITGPIYVAGNGLVERLVVSDSIIQSLDPAVAAIDLPRTEMTCEGITVLGADEERPQVRVNKLSANAMLVRGQIDVTDGQTGCFRFSAATEGSHVPHPYESHIIGDTAHYFTSQRFGDPGYGQLSASVPAEIRRGAEDGSEMGAFSRLLNPIKEDDLLSKIAEYVPFGLIPILIYET